MSAAQGPATLDLLVELSDALVTDLDVDGLLEKLTNRCVELVGAQVAAIMLADSRGTLRLLAAAPEYATWIDLLEASHTPGNWSFATGLPVSDADLDVPDPRWAAFARQAREGGFRSVTAVPMRVRGEVIGVFNVLRHRAGWLTPEQLGLTRSLANIAAAGLLMQHDQRYRTVLAAQSQRLLNGRVAIERARGILAESLGIGVDTALDEMRRHAARIGEGLSTVADQVVAGVPVTRHFVTDKPIQLIHRITTDTLTVLRTLVRQQITGAGLSGSAADAFLLAVHEAAVNAEEHAGGGRLWLWRHRGNLWCEVSDDGPGLEMGSWNGTNTPQPADMRHAGLWLIRRICPDAQVTSTPQGTRILLRQPIPSHPGSSFPFVDAGG
ncbi:GAF domain-containing protein [Actinoplanes sp. NPDC020271]|uniref:GAF domain-containing protein n=1 Tax=Actinoplanes sp. NPDC020271 TaxID=3363896 RepID=UPI00379718D8